jgi:hypothetical protein
MEKNGDLIIASLASALLVGPILGCWPLVGVIAAVGTALYINNSNKSDNNAPRR